MINELTQSIAALKKRGVSTFPANVVSVDKSDGTCTINDGELEYTDVQLSAIVDGDKKHFFLYPKVGSSVLVSPIDEDIHRLYIEVYSEIEELDLQIDGVNLNIDKDGFLLKKENETLKKLMGDFIQACRNMVFQTNSGITFELLNDPEFEALETRFNQFLK
jgi:hypothetical protein